MASGWERIDKIWTTDTSWSILETEAFEANTRNKAGVASGDVNLFFPAQSAR
jgi:hypothetical protein